MKRFKALLWTVNVIVLVLVLSLTATSLFTGVVWSVAYNYGIQQVSQTKYEYLEDIFLLRYRYGGFQFSWNPAISGMNISPFPMQPPERLNVGRLTTYRFDYPIERYSRVDYTGALDRNGVRHDFDLTNRGGWGFQYFKVIAQSQDGRKPPIRKLSTASVTVPIWPVVLIWASFTAWSMKRRLVGWKRGARAKRGHCAYCNYDLFGIISNRCPECGQTRYQAGFLL